LQRNEESHCTAPPRKFKDEQIVRYIIERTGDLRQLNSGVHLFILYPSSFNKKVLHCQLTQLTAFEVEASHVHQAAQPSAGSSSNAEAAD